MARTAKGQRDLIDFAEVQHQDRHAEDAACIVELRAALADMVGAVEYPMNPDLWAACERACELLERRAE